MSWRLLKKLALIVVLMATRPAMAEPTKPVSVFAAASLADVLQAVDEDWPGTMRISLAGSGAIARQIDQGAPADVVLLANPDWMEWLDTRGHLEPNTRSTPFGNSLVLVGPKDTPPLPDLTLDDLLDRLGDNGRLAMGEHRSVPAGQYARAWLEKRGMWDALRSRLAETDNVRSALALVARNEVPLAILYRSDLVAAKGSIRAVWDIPADQQPDIRYALAALTPEGVELAAFLASPEALSVFERFGFTR